MRTIRSVRAGWFMGAVGACVLYAGGAGAEIAIERPGSLLLFPKVVADGTRDTIIELTNTGNMQNCALCFYLDGQDDDRGDPVWTVVDFQLCLTRQQPTHWRVSTGRRVNPLDGDQGLDPGLIPAASSGFTGALICMEVNSDGLPASQNRLKGEATLEGENLATFHDFIKYNAEQLQAINPNPDTTLLLNGAEYDACPATHRVNFVPSNQTSPVVEELGNAGTCVGGANAGAPCNNDTDCASLDCDEGQTSTLTNITVLPCNLELANGLPSSVTLSFTGRDEFEVLFSSSTTVDCWGTVSLADTFFGPILGQFASVQITSVVGGPVVLVAESFHADSIQNTGSAAVNDIVSGTDPTAVVRVAFP